MRLFLFIFDFTNKNMWKTVHKKRVCLASENCNLGDRDSGRTE